MDHQFDSFINLIIPIVSKNLLGYEENADRKLTSAALYELAPGIVAVRVEPTKEWCLLVDPKRYQVSNDFQSTAKKADSGGWMFICVGDKKINVVEFKNQASNYLLSLNETTHWHNIPQFHSVV